MEEEKTEITQTQPKKEKRVRTPEEKKKLFLRIFIPILSVVLATGVFFAGFFVRQGTLDEGMQTLIRIKDTIQKEYYEDISDKAFYDTIFEAVNENLLDDYSRYMDSEEYAKARTEATGAQSGIGLVLYTGGTNASIVRVIGNSPAEQAGLLAGDIIQRYAKKGETLTAGENASAFFAYVSALPKDTEITIEVLRGEETFNFTLKKSTYAEGYVYYRTRTSAYRCTGADALTFKVGGEPLADLPDDTAYIRLTAFNGSATKQFASAMSRFKTDGKKNLLLDLRANGGGYMDILQDIAKYFCKSSKKLLPLIAIADYGEKQQKYYASGNDYDEYFKADSKIYVIADSGTASASEVLLGAILDYGATSPQNVYLCERDGVAKTYGKGIMQTTYPFGIGSGQDAIKLTTAKLFWPNSGKCIHGRGYLPNDGAKTVAEGNTEEIELQSIIAQMR